MRRRLSSVYGVREFPMAMRVIAQFVAIVVVARQELYRILSHIDLTGCNDGA